MIRSVTTLILFVFSTALFAQFEDKPDSVSGHKIVDLDSALDTLIQKPKSLDQVTHHVIDSIKQDMSDAEHLYARKIVKKLINKVPLATLDSSIQPNQLLLIPLVTKRLKEPLNIKDKLYNYSLNMGKRKSTLYDFHVVDSNDFLSVTEQKKQIADNAFFSILTTRPDLIAYHADQLPSTKEVESHYMSPAALDKLRLFEDSALLTRPNNKLVLRKIKPVVWTHKANAYLQFSQNFISKNWHQGGSDNLAVLGTLTAKVNYDDKSNIQWENSAEWRAGFHSVEGDTLRLLNTNDDILRVNSKLGVKAGGKFFYSGLFEFSTPLFTTYKAVNSQVMKAAFMTPVRINMGFGLDYKLEKKLSVMLSPISYKYIFLNNPNVDPKLFGITTGEHILSEVGSSLKVQGVYAPTKEITFDNKFSFYTNYEKVEIDWEIVGNFQINRFLSTRIMLNPRYDNTVILAKGEHAKLQFKEILTFGLSYRLLR